MELKLLYTLLLWKVLSFQERLLLFSRKGISLLYGVLRELKTLCIGWANEQRIDPHKRMTAHMVRKDLAKAPNSHTFLNYSMQKEHIYIYI